MEELLGALFQIFGELFLQLLFEALAELGHHGLKETFKREKSPVHATIGFSIWGGLAGVISLFLFPRSFIASKDLRILNLVVTPLICGEILRQAGKLRQTRGQSLVGLDRFSYAFAFALAMALVRFFLAKSAA